jgi:hypothetical protein
MAALAQRLEATQLEPAALDRAQVIIARIAAAAAGGDLSQVVTLQGEFRRAGAVIIEITQAQIAIAGLCAASFVLGGVSAAIAAALWVARRLGLTWSDAWAMLRGR